MNSASFTELRSVSARCVRSVRALSRISKLVFVDIVGCLPVALRPSPVSPSSRALLLAPRPHSPSYTSPFPTPWPPSSPRVHVLPPTPLCSRHRWPPSSSPYVPRPSPSSCALPLVSCPRLASRLAPRPASTFTLLRPSIPDTVGRSPRCLASLAPLLPPAPRLSSLARASLLAPRPRSPSYASLFPTPLAALLVALRPSPLSFLPRLASRLLFVPRFSPRVCILPPTPLCSRSPSSRIPPHPPFPPFLYQKKLYLPPLGDNFRLILITPFIGLDFLRLCVPLLPCYAFSHPPSMYTCTHCPPWDGSAFPF
jgi:hypothetical protein